MGDRQHSSIEFVCIFDDKEEEGGRGVNDGERREEDWFCKEGVMLMLGFCGGGDDRLKVGELRGS